MRLGLVSDSQGEVDALVRALDAFEAARVDRVFFLGGRWADLEAALERRQARLQAPSAPATAAPVPRTDLEFLAAVQGALARQVPPPDPLASRLVRVASRDCPEEASVAPRKVVDLLDGRICALVHDKADLSRDDIENASLLFHGKADAAALVRIGPRVFVTPGPLGPPPGGVASWGLVELDAAEVALAVHGLDGALLRTVRAPLAGGGKVSVR
ncbi:MAG: hypothetical protein QM767_20390 [Anaeromyxobacter sp.]